MQAIIKKIYPKIKMILVDNNVKNNKSTKNYQSKFHKVQIIMKYKRKI